MELIECIKPRKIAFTGILAEEYLLFQILLPRRISSYKGASHGGEQKSEILFFWLNEGLQTVSYWGSVPQHPIPFYHPRPFFN